MHGFDDFDTQIQSDERYADYDYFPEEYDTVSGNVSHVSPNDARDYDPAGDGWGVDDLDALLGD